MRRNTNNTNILLSQADLTRLKENYDFLVNQLRILPKNAPERVEIEKQMDEIKQTLSIYRDLAHLVAEQASMLDNIEEQSTKNPPYKSIDNIQPEILAELQSYLDKPVGYFDNQLLTEERKVICQFVVNHLNIKLSINDLVALLTFASQSNTFNTTSLGGIFDGPGVFQKILNAYLRILQSNDPLSVLDSSVEKWKNQFENDELHIRSERQYLRERQQNIYNINGPFDPAKLKPLDDSYFPPVQSEEQERRRKIEDEQALNFKKPPQKPRSISTPSQYSFWDGVKENREKTEQLQYKTKNLQKNMKAFKAASEEIKKEEKPWYQKIFNN